MVGLPACCDAVWTGSQSLDTSFVSPFARVIVFPPPPPPLVATTMIINILKIFDVVYLMTGGNYHTDVVGMEFYNQLFNFSNYGMASALAIVLFLAITPIMFVNIRRMRAEEVTR